MDTVIKYKADDGSEYYRKEEAEAQNFFLKVRKVLRGASYNKWPADYDGPMPVYEPDLQTLCHHKEKLRHLFLDVEPPVPETVIRDRVVIQHRFPHWSAWVALLVVGFIIGRII